ncbi:unnamed protein product, partial [Vitis vinifera]
MSGLIEGLPDAVALRCLAWVPFYLHPRLELVSRSWRDAIRGPELFKARQEESYLYLVVAVMLCRKSISQAEIYDPEKDAWVSIPDLHRTHNSACSGVVLDGKVHVLHKGLTTVQILDKVGPGWRVEDYGWLQGPMAIVQGALYVMSHGIIFKQEREVKKMVVSASEFRRRIGFAMTGLRDEIYVIGGVIGPDRWNWDIKPLSDVDVLTIGSERPAWRQVSPMSQCRGTIFGCTQLRI